MKSVDLSGVHQALLKNGPDLLRDYDDIKRKIASALYLFEQCEEQGLSVPKELRLGMERIVFGRKVKNRTRRRKMLEAI